MMTATYQRRIPERLPRMMMFGLFALAATLFSASETRAQWATNGNNINNTNTGNVGVGTANPAARLHAAAPTGSTTSSVTITPDGTNTYYAGNAHDALFIDGSLTSPHGLYTAAALRLLRVKTADNADSLLVGKYGDLTTAPKTNNIGYTLRLAPDASNGYHTGHNHDILLINGSGLNNHGMYTGSTVRLMRVVNAAGGDALSVARDGNATFGGNVGIGTAPSAAKLNVGGDLNATGTITGGNIVAKYQDVAEWVPSAQKLSAGTVVILDPQRSNQVLASVSSYDTSVAGVISAQPGIALGERGEGKVLVATTGRVKVKVDATRGAIRVGDLLVTSDKEGYAMKSEPVMVGNRKLHSPGTIVGKALEPLEKDTGEILVLLSLQ